MCSNIAAVDKGRNPTDTAYLITDWIIFKNHRHETVRFPLFLECISLLLPCFTADCLLFLISKHLHSYEFWIVTTVQLNYFSVEATAKPWIHSQQIPGVSNCQDKSYSQTWCCKELPIIHPKPEQAHCWQKMQDMFTWQNFYLRVLSFLLLRWVNFRVLSITYDKTSISF